MNKKYDVIIIGSGIGGLVAGNYLAMAGKKVLVLERHSKPGGYCTSFQRGRYVFDAGPHAFGSMRSGGQLGKLFRELRIGEKIKIRRTDMSNILVFPDRKIYFHNNIEKTIAGMKESFPKEAKNIDGFFTFLLSPNIGFLYSGLKNYTFSDLLGKYFSDEKLKEILGMVTGNLGLSYKRASAFTSCILYREHIFDGGYYLEGGTQALPNVLAENLRCYGGEIHFSTRVTRVLTKNKTSIGVKLQSGDAVLSEYVIANCDALHLFTDLIEKTAFAQKKTKHVASMKPSPSFFVCYLGLDKLPKGVMTECSTLWYFDDYNFSSISESVWNGKFQYKGEYIVAGFPQSSNSDTQVVNLIVLAPYIDKVFWEENKENVSKIMINRASKILPELTGKIKRISNATPYDFFRYTQNYHGAISGWASIPGQIGSNLIPTKTEIKNLLMAGHWTTSGGGQGGIPMVVFSGKKAAKTILEKCESGKMYANGIELS